MQQTDVVIAGAGVIGMSLALELRRRGRRVTLIERAQPGSGASQAAAGMLAAHDRANPPDLRPLADLSLELYPSFLDRLAQLAPQLRVPFQTCWTLEASSGGSDTPLPAGLCAGSNAFRFIRERSLDPRQLSAALIAACSKAGVRLLHATPLRGVVPESRNSLRIDTGDSAIHCAQFVDCTGAWSACSVRPVKGQMLRVQLGAATPCLPEYGNVVVRTASIYIVPRLDGSAVIGATLEEKGFCIKTKDATIHDLRERAAMLLPAVAAAPELERWAGGRTACPDGLPLLGDRPGSLAGTRRGPFPNAPSGNTPNTCFIASGHFRNGILLAPATAHVMAQLLCGEKPGIALDRFSPGRFAVAPAIIARTS